MNYKQMIMKYKQTILMALSLLLILAFFMPWVYNVPAENGFAFSEFKMSGLKLFKGYQTIVELAFGLLSEKLNIVSKLLYLGYLIILFPVIGLVSLVLSGIRHKKAALAYMIHFVSSFAVLLLVFLVILLFKEIRIMFFSTFGLRFALGFYLTLLLSGLGIAVIQITRKK